MADSEMDIAVENAIHEFDTAMDNFEDARMNMLEMLSMESLSDEDRDRLEIEYTRVHDRMFSLMTPESPTNWFDKLSEYVSKFISWLMKAIKFVYHHLRDVEIATQRITTTINSIAALVVAWQAVHVTIRVVGISHGVIL